MPTIRAKGGHEKFLVSNYGKMGKTTHSNTTSLTTTTTAKGGGLIDDGIDKEGEKVKKVIDVDDDGSDSSDFC